MFSEMSLNFTKNFDIFGAATMKSGAGRTELENKRSAKFHINSELKRLF